MSDLKRYGNQVWDRLFELLYACDESITDAEVDADLQRAGIDVRPTIRRVQHLIEQAKARMQLARAAATRASMIDKIRDVVVPKVDDLRAGVKNLIDRVFTGSAQVAHYQKLETAATEEDLKTLLEDLTKLAAMRQSEIDNESKAK
jgi:hypothetical protein